MTDRSHASPLPLPECPDLRHLREQAKDLLRAGEATTLSQAQLFSVPKPVWRGLKAAGRIEHHPVFPDAEGWAQRRIASQEDVDDVIALLRLNYERQTAKHGSLTITRST